MRRPSPGHVYVVSDGVSAAPGPRAPRPPILPAISSSDVWVSPPPLYPPGYLLGSSLHGPPRPPPRGHRPRRLARTARAPRPSTCARRAAWMLGRYAPRPRTARRARSRRRWQRASTSAVSPRARRRCDARGCVRLSGAPPPPTCDAVAARDGRQREQPTRRRSAPPRCGRSSRARATCARSLVPSLLRGSRRAGVIPAPRRRHRARRRRAHAGRAPARHLREGAGGRARPLGGVGRAARDRPPRRPALGAPSPRSDHAGPPRTHARAGARCARRGRAAPLRRSRRRRRRRRNARRRPRAASRRGARAGRAGRSLRRRSARARSSPTPRSARSRSRPSARSETASSMAAIVALLDAPWAGRSPRRRRGPRRARRTRRRDRARSSPAHATSPTLARGAMWRAAARIGGALAQPGRAAYRRRSRTLGARGGPAAPTAARRARCIAGDASGALIAALGGAPSDSRARRTTPTHASRRRSRWVMRASTRRAARHRSRWRARARARRGRARRAGARARAASPRRRRPDAGRAAWRARRSSRIATREGGSALSLAPVVALSQLGALRVAAARDLVAQLVTV